MVYVEKALHFGEFIDHRAFVTRMFKLVLEWLASVTRIGQTSPIHGSNSGSTVARVLAT